MADAVLAWIENGAANSENFFVDEDARAPAPGTINIGVGGCFTFNMQLAPPHAVTLLNPGASRALPKFVAAVNATPCKDAAECLGRATRAYLAIADELDAEAAAEDGGEDDEYAGGGGGGAVDLLDHLHSEAKDAEAEARRLKQRALEEEMSRVKAQYDVGAMPKACVERIMSDYARVKDGKHFGWSAAPSGRDLSLWTIEMFDFEKGTALAKDMEQVSKRTGKAAVELTMKFPAEYPWKPPFIRVVRPRFAFRTGRVTVGGSICTQLLTDDGWKPIYDIESIIETIRQQITDPESGAKIDHSNTSDYTESEAREAFQRVAAYHKEHGW